MWSYSTRGAAIAVLLTAGGQVIKSINIASRIGNVIAVTLLNELQVEFVALGSFNPAQHGVEGYLVSFSEFGILEIQQLLNPVKKSVLERGEKHKKIVLLMTDTINRLSVHAIEDLLGRHLAAVKRLANSQFESITIPMPGPVNMGGDHHDIRLVG